ncbi:ABC-type branched-subunit amino acid transport system substrate-binding protein [Polaromonas sp. CG_9.11]|nr:ABC-type branched-subunit amino acid transport system substrate-binding protein [Polaromonas sp. CG_9.11]
MKLKPLAAIGLITLSGSIAAQHSGVSDNVVKIGLILDMSSLYADITGMGSVNAAKMAIEDFGGKVVGKPIELVYADHQNKPDIAASKAREWFDREKVDAILDVAASAPALAVAVAEVAREKNRVVVFSGPGSVRLTNEACTPSTVHYVYDTYALGRVNATEAPRQ